MPDWKEEKDYDFFDQLSNEAKAWEFLRRNQHYIKAYNERTNGLKLYQPKPKPLFEFQRLKHYEKMIAEPFMLKTMHDPNQKFSDKIKFCKVNSCPYLVKSIPDAEQFFNEYDPWTLDASPSKTKILVTLDLSFAIEAQLKKIKVLADKIKVQNNIKKEVFKTHASKTKRHLRILDGLSAGANTKEIAEVFGYNEFNEADKSAGSQAGDYVSQAQKMAEKGYKAFLI